MANQFGVDLEGKYVILKDDWIYKDFENKETIKGTIVERVFYCRGGFGCNPEANGTLIGGYIIFNGLSLGIRGYGYMERLATKEEIQNAIQMAKNNGVELECL